MQLLVRQMLVHQSQRLFERDEHSFWPVGRMSGSLEAFDDRLLLGDQSLAYRNVTLRLLQSGFAVIGHTAMLRRETPPTANPAGGRRCRGAIRSLSGSGGGSRDSSR